MKFLIIGSAGAGKSTLARRLHEATGIELIYLDKLYWKPNWVETSEEEWKRTIENLLKKDSWIMDGNYSGMLEMRAAACDTLIFLDLPRAICVRRVVKRSLFYKKSNRPDMAAGCDEKLDTEFLKFLKWIWDYPTRTKPKVEDLMKRFENGKTIFRLTSQKEIENFFVKYSAYNVKSS